MNLRDFLVGFTVGSLVTAIACVYVFLSAYARVLKEQREKSGL